MKKIIKISLLILFVNYLSINIFAQQNQSSITLTANPPPQVTGVSASVTSGKPNINTYFYWVIAIYPIGRAPISLPAQVINVPNSGSVTISWNPATGTSGYDVLRTTTSIVPTTGCGCALVVNQSSVSPSSYIDTLGNTIAYNVSNFATNATSTIQLDNQNYSVPTLLQFPNPGGGSSLLPPGTIVSGSNISFPGNVTVGITVPTTIQDGAGVIGPNQLVTPLQYMPASVAAVIGDGNSHPLSVVYGTLGAAQVVYSNATSLSNEFFCLALQKAVTAANRVFIPTTTAIYLCNTTVTLSANQAVFSFHQGSQGSANTNDGPVIKDTATTPIFDITGLGAFVAGIGMLGQESVTPFNTYGGSLIRLNNNASGHIQNCNMKYATYPILINGNNTQRFFIHDNFIGFDYYALFVPVSTALADSVISRNEIWSSAVAVYAVAGIISYSIFSSNLIFGNSGGTNAFVLVNSTGNVFTANRMDTWSDSCMYIVGQTSGGSIASNVFLNCDASTNNGAIHIFPANAAYTATGLAIQSNVYVGNSKDIFNDNFAGGVVNSIISDIGRYSQTRTDMYFPSGSSIGDLEVATPFTGTSGTASCTQTAKGVQKVISCILTAYANTSAAQTYTFPIPFSTAPILSISSGSCGTYNPTMSTTVLTLPANAAMTAETCNIIVNGQ